MTGLDKREEGAFDIGIRDHCFGANASEHDSSRAAALDSDLGDSSLEPQLSVARLDRFDEDIGQSAG